MSNPKLNRSRIVVWAVNPFEVETRPDPAAISELRDWAMASGYAIQPVHALYVSAAPAPSDDYGPWVKRFIPAVELEISNYLKGMDLPSLLPPKVLVHQGVSILSAVDALIQHAQDIEAEWIVTSSKGRSGLRRLALGSFAESLLIRSPIPVWVFGHGKPVRLDSQRILFSTDFSEVSKLAFSRVVEQASKLCAKVTLFHCINLPDLMLSGAGVMGVSTAFPVEEYLRDQAKWAKLTAVHWAQAANERGVAVDYVIKEVVPNIANAIVFEASQANAGAIALASTSGAVDAALLGSHARQVIRQTECPVWVFGPKCSKLGASLPNGDAAKVPAFETG